MKKVLYYTITGSRYHLNENNVSFRLKRYQKDDGIRYGNEIFGSNGELYRPQKAVRLSVFITEEEYQRICWHSGKEDVTINVASLIPFAGLLPFEIVSDRVRVSVPNGSSITIHDFQNLKNGCDYHFGDAVDASRPIKWCDDKGEFEYDVYRVSPDVEWHTR